MRNRRVRYVAVPMRTPENEMLGTIGNVTRERGAHAGESVTASILWGEYVSRDNMAHYTVGRFGIRGVRYRIFRAYSGPTGWQSLGDAFPEDWGPGTARIGQDGWKLAADA